MSTTPDESPPAPPEVSVTDAPVRTLPGEDDEPQDGAALCLSGGGYRAMVFHVGVLWRLNELGLLHGLKRISSVSGGSITAGVLAMNWSRLDFEDHVATGFQRHLVEPVRNMARQGVDVSSVLSGLLMPRTSVSDRVVKAYRKHLFGKTSLQDLPDEPRFVLNATNVESGVLMRFSKPYLADYRVGRINDPDLPLAVAVAASSAFPPVLSPCKVDLEHEDWITEQGNDLAQSRFREVVSLSDGGVYDNLGLETVWKRYRTILVSDAGGHLGADSDPAGDWARHLARVLSVIDNQVRSLRKRQAIDAFRSGRREGMYVGIRSHLSDYPVHTLPADHALTRKLAAIPTRLDPMDDDQQELLINWGYVVCDAGLRSHVVENPAAGSLPYPDRPLERGGDT